MNGVSTPIGRTRRQEKLDSGGHTKPDDWYCLQIEPWTCMNCGTQFSHLTHAGMHGEHFIIVWPASNDPNMYAQIAERDGKAAIVPYEDALGPALSYYAIEPS